MKNTTYNLIGFALLVILSLAVVLYKPVNLGLDLRGGISMVLEPDYSKALKHEYEKTARLVEKTLREKGLRILDVLAYPDRLEIEYLEESELPRIEEAVRDIIQDAVIERKGEGILRVTFSTAYLEQFRKDIIDQTIEVLRNRIDKLGVAQPVVTRLGKERILVELPGFLDIERAKRIIGSTASLELKLVIDSSYSREELEKKLTKNTEILPSREGQEWFLVDKVPVISGSDLKTAYMTKDEFGAPAVGFELKSEAADKFGEFTYKNIGKRLAIVLEDKVVSAPVIRSRISDRGQITGNFTPQEVRDLALILRTGALPTSLKILQEKVVGPSLGKDAIEQGIKAGVLGFFLLLLVVIVRYKTAGVSATVSILLNGLLLWAGLAGLGATLTLPGIAGIILNMGIAVDSNVLIFERVKEELKLGNTLRKAIELGYRRTLSAVWDTHITLLVASLILFQFGSGPVKGFATTLAIGTIASFLSNVYYAKVFLDFLAKRRWLKI
ncbi:protein translocase subunit SecD [Hydrogenivirga sp. 128-5-R1-1]|uniref:protein translocase subunit SecD n=1 Tax=Hydrogenivirga sp. 128-5-R1-1 TaxID=392423 RepID=UPI00015F3843|nr:protein translocase subunit SecD [Hydrogenivirga sp. 128-5-R1-1]EDP76678.1 protein export membrane protein SecD [Hydrogenivirga sp. 128-5-R1-1]